MAADSRWPLLARSDVGKDILELLKDDPMGAKIQANGVLVAVGTALAITAAIFIVFLLVRPFNSTVYAPRLLHTDEKHRPPPLGKGLFAWVNPVFRHNENQYVETIGMDATVFLRVARMCRNMFIVLAIAGCAIVLPVNIMASEKQNGMEFEWEGKTVKVTLNALVMMTPQYLFGEKLWAFVALAYVCDFIICGFLWWNYRAIHRLRRRYLESEEYQNSLYSRTLMITDIPRSLRSDHGIVEITDAVRTVPEVPRPAIGRNVKDIPHMIEAHEEAVIALEKVLAKYLKNPNQLPPERPLCSRSKKDPNFASKDEKVDAIDYLTERIQRLEEEIKQARQSVDKRDAMPYGFASYESIESAHSVAYAGKSKHHKGTTVQLAPRPSDIIWKNLPLSPKARRWRRFINNVWIVVLTLFYFIPNALIAIFLTDLSNLGKLWPAFGQQLIENSTFWSIVQGIAAPALTSLFYYFLPIIFRRLSIKAGDTTKSSRERHVIQKLYSFFVFNNLIVFSFFAAVFTFISVAVEDARDKGVNVWDFVRGYKYDVQFVATLINVSPFWITWLVQRNLGAAIDLAQVVNLAWGSFSRKFLNPTPRELILRTAPPPFDYASYYNYFLFYSTVALCFAAMQPLTLVVTAFYFALDASMKKYLLLYVFCTKNESGGQYWRVIFNRFLIGTILSNLIIVAMVASRAQPFRKEMLTALLPLFAFLIVFKLYCRFTFDTSMRYLVSKKVRTPKGAEAPPPIDKEARKRDRVGVRFGHPALWQKLTVPMVHKKSQHLLAEVYRGRLDGDLGTTAGFSDTYMMKRMSKETPGKMENAGPFEFVEESNMDFANFKNRPEFSDEAGGDGSIYGHVSRPGTPGGMSTTSTNFGRSGRGRSNSRDSERTFAMSDDGRSEMGVGVTYPTGYHNPPSNLREYSPSPDRGRGEFGRMRSNESNPYAASQDLGAGLLGSAAPMGRQTPTGDRGERGWTPYTPEREGGADYFRR